MERTKLGRPPGKTKNVTFSISLPRLLALALKRKSRSLGISRNALIRLALGAEFYEERKEEMIEDVAD